MYVNIWNGSMAIISSPKRVGSWQRQLRTYIDKPLGSDPSHIHERKNTQQWARVVRRMKLNNSQDSHVTSAPRKELCHTQWSHQNTLTKVLQPHWTGKFPLDWGFSGPASWQAHLERTLSQLSPGQSQLWQHINETQPMNKQHKILFLPSNQNLRGMQRCGPI